MRVKLKKDIVIKSGTIFEDAPTKTIRHGKGHIGATFALSKDSCGFIEYDLIDYDDLKEYFEIIEK
ncbi:MAG: hypothetical protein HN952_04540 [Candidatus Cloacimonetes bacterium]|jgi:hypothetical protein|nr:hypothetical protein [Candidatus Cloacimonadota bacterium]MBT7469885.1 hypothetical protein [Candidatus Cloacimonadota bacterium]